MHFWTNLTDFRYINIGVLNVPAYTLSVQDPIVVKEDLLKAFKGI